MIIDFGQYKGADLDDVVENDPGYLIWVYENITGQYIVDDDLYAELLEEQK